MGEPHFFRKSEVPPHPLLQKYRFEGCDHKALIETKLMDQEASAPEKKIGEQSESAAPSGKEAGPQEAPKEGLKKEYVIDIFRDWCKGCGICAEFCPKKCLKMNAEGEPEVIDAKGCTGCGWCELHCPDFAICVRERAAKKAAEEAD